MRPLAAFLFLLAASGPVAAQMSAACEEDIANVDRSFDETLTRLDSVANSGDPEKCAAYQHHVDVMLAAREVFLRCLTGHARNENAGQLEVSIDDFRVVMANKCKQP